MTSFLEQLAPYAAASDEKPFRPVARYYPPMDFLLYLNEDCSYCADRVDKFLTLLWHPYEDKLVGIKLKGLRYIFNQKRDRLSKYGTLSWPIFALLSEILMDVLAEPMLAVAEESRREMLREKYREAVLFVAKENAHVSTEELKKAA
jgi:hypothetical protein